VDADPPQIKVFQSCIIGTPGSFGPTRDQNGKFASLKQPARGVSKRNAQTKNAGPTMTSLRWPIWKNSGRFYFENTKGAEQPTKMFFGPIVSWPAAVRIDSWTLPARASAS
jgi:hypothetical protein